MLERCYGASHLEDSIADVVSFDRNSNIPYPPHLRIYMYDTP